MGIVNGTTNYILTRMSEEGASFSDALAEAQTLGFAERDPTADVEGFDAAAKAAIIATIAFGARVVAGDVYREGISELTDADMASARELGYVVKLLAVAEEDAHGVAVRVHPTMIPVAPPARLGARVVQRGVHRGRRGRRADVLRPRRRRRADRERGARRPHRRGEEPGRAAAGAPRSARSPASRSGRSTRSRASSTCSSRWPISPACSRRSRRSSASTTCRSSPCSRSASAPTPGIIFITHRAREADLRATVHALRDVKSVHRVGSVLRVMGDEPG